MGGITIVRAGPERIDDIVDMWIVLHEHHETVQIPIPGIRRLRNDETAPVARREYLEWLAEPDAFCFLTEEDGRAVGYAFVFFHESDDAWDTGRVAFLHSLAVRPGMRGRGAGRLLMDAVYDEMRRLGVRTLELGVLSGNEAARTLYDREGFTTWFLHMMKDVPPS